MTYIVSINATGLSTTAPSDGFIDPTTFSQYYSKMTYVGSKAAEVLDKDSSFYINGIVISPLEETIPAIADAINATTYKHHCLAQIEGGKLKLTTTPLHWDVVPVITDITEGVREKLGFVDPVLEDHPTMPDTKDAVLPKVRANMRWLSIIDMLSLTGNVNIHFRTSPDSATMVDPAVKIDFLVTPQDNYYNFDFSGNMVYGATAVKYAIAKALMLTSKKLCTFYDPTFTDEKKTLRKGEVLEKVEIGALTNDQTVAYNAITITTL